MTLKSKNQLTDFKPYFVLRFFFLVLISLLLFFIPSSKNQTSEASQKSLKFSHFKKPKNCSLISLNENLQERIAKAPPHSALCLMDGVYKGNLSIHQPLTLWGTRNSIIRSTGKGTNLRILSDETIIMGLTLDGSGNRYDLQDASIYIKGDHVSVTDVLITDATFGIVVQQSNHILLFKNKILGKKNVTALGLRGDAIRLWETRHSQIRENEILNSRDIIIWYSYNNHIINNSVKNGRYGTHFMYSHRNFILNNRYIGNVVGLFVMYSRHNTFKKNLLAGSHGAAGYGLGMKESGQIKFIENKIYKNTIGIYLDNSPYDPRFENVFSKNQIQMNSTAILFHSSPRWNVFEKNSFKNNLNLIRVDGGGNTKKIKWEKNYFDTYKGYDLNGDSIGDKPFQLKRLSGDLMGKYPVLAFFRGTLAFSFIDIVGKVIPLFSPELLLEDRSPSMKENPGALWK